MRRHLSAAEATAVLTREGRQVQHVVDLARLADPPPPVSESAWNWLYRRLADLTGSDIVGLHNDTFAGAHVMSLLLRHQRRHIRWRLPGLRGEKLSAAVNWSNLDCGPQSRVGPRMQRFEPDAIIIARAQP